MVESGKRKGKVIHINIAQSLAALDSIGSLYRSAFPMAGQWLSIEQPVPLSDHTLHLPGGAA